MNTCKRSWNKKIHICAEKLSVNLQEPNDCPNEATIQGHEIQSGSVTESRTCYFCFDLLWDIQCLSLGRLFGPTNEFLNTRYTQ